MRPKTARFNHANMIYLSHFYFWPQHSKIDTSKVSENDTYSMKGKSQTPLYMGYHRPSRPRGGGGLCLLRVIM